VRYPAAAHAHTPLAKPLQARRRIRRSRGRKGKVAVTRDAAGLSPLPLWLPRSSATLTLYFSRPRFDGSQRHRRPCRSIWRRWRRTRTRPHRRSPLRQHHRAFPTHRSQAPLPDHRRAALGELQRNPSQTLTPPTPSSSVAETTSDGRRSRLDRTARNGAYRFGLPEVLTGGPHWPAI
jgi:hypothetical protein